MSVSFDFLCAFVLLVISVLHAVYVKLFVVVVNHMVFVFVWLRLS